MNLSEDQSNAFDQIMEWYKNGITSELTFGGYAGTGKTTLISYLRQFLGEKLKVRFMSFTGKATQILRRKLNNNNILLRFPLDVCSTIHSSIYQPIVDEDTNEVIEWTLRPTLDCDIIIVDEASMLSKEIYEDLKSFDKPVLFVGDHGQLGPVSDNFNLMENPNIKLNKIHRVAQDNPIIKLSEIVRNEGYIEYGYFGDSIAKVHKNDPLISEFINNSGGFLDTIILCGFNKTRINTNKKIRDHFGYSKLSNYPTQGERVICLKNNKNAVSCPIFNGSQGTVKSCSSQGTYLDMAIEIDGEQNHYHGFVSLNAFNEQKPEMRDFPIRLSREKRLKEKKEFMYCDYYDFGYATTVHKAQGSEWARVMCIEEPCSYWAGEDWNRWLYTCVTRSSKQLLIVR